MSPPASTMRPPDPEHPRGPASCHGNTVFTKRTPFRTLSNSVAVSLLSFPPSGKFLSLSLTLVTLTREVTLLILMAL